MTLTPEEETTLRQFITNKDKIVALVAKQAELDRAADNLVTEETTAAESARRANFYAVRDWKRTTLLGEQTAAMQVLNDAWQVREDADFDLTGVDLTGFE